MSDSDLVTLVSHDNVEVQLPRDHLVYSSTINNLMEDADDGSIPLPNIDGTTLLKVAAFLGLIAVHNNEKPNEKITPIGDISPDMEPFSWATDFVKVDQTTLFNLILAANYLDIKYLLHVCCYQVATMIKGKTPHEIRNTFGIENDFTPEEEEQIKRENEWIEEK